MSDIEITSHSTIDPNVFTYRVDARSLLLSSSHSSIMQRIHDSLVEKCAKDLLEKNGERIIYEVLQSEGKIKADIQRRLEENIDSVLVLLARDEDAFRKKELCRCGMTDTLESQPNGMYYLVRHKCTLAKREPMDSLTYLEWRHKRVVDFIQGALSDLFYK